MSGSEIDAVCPQMCVVHSSEPKAIGMVAILRPKRAFRPRSGQKIARGSAQYDASPSASFCLLFLARQKKWVCEATVAVSLQKRQSGESEKRDGQMSVPLGYVPVVRRAAGR